MESISFIINVNGHQEKCQGYAVGKYLAVTKSGPGRWACFHIPCGFTIFTGSFCTRTQAIEFCQDFEEFITDLDIKLSTLSPSTDFTEEQIAALIRFRRRYANGE
jgi:hypothetical protein